MAPTEAPEDEARCECGKLAIAPAGMCWDCWSTMDWYNDERLAKDGRNSS